MGQTTVCPKFEAKNRVFKFEYQKTNTSFDVRKTDVWVCSLSNLVNLVKVLLGSKFDVQSFEAKNRVFKFDNY